MWLDGQTAPAVWASFLYNTHPLTLSVSHTHTRTDARTNLDTAALSQMFHDPSAISAPLSISVSRYLSAYLALSESPWLEKLADSVKLLISTTLQQREQTAMPRQK